LLAMRVNCFGWHNLKGNVRVLDLRVWQVAGSQACMQVHLHQTISIRSPGRKGDGDRVVYESLQTARGKPANGCAV
jgi:hypothetical protein